MACVNYSTIQISTSKTPSFPIVFPIVATSLARTKFCNLFSEPQATSKAL
jgi:hypothetical protein